MDDKPIATWSVSLDCVCPKCLEFVDLMSHPEFWEMHSGLILCEHATDQSNNLEVVCPTCSHVFTAELEY